MMHRMTVTDYSHNPNMDKMMKEVIESGMTAETKLGLMALLSGYMSKKDEMDAAVREQLLTTYMKYEEPIQLMKVICDEESPYFEPVFAELSHQRVKAQMRFLCAAGLMERSEEYTGRTIRVNKTKEVPEVIVKFRFVK